MASDAQAQLAASRRAQGQTSATRNVAQYPYKAGPPRNAGPPPPSITYSRERPQSATADAYTDHFRGILQDRDTHIVHLVNNHAQSQAALLKDLQDCKTQLSTCRAETLHLTQRIDDMHITLQQADKLVRKSREDTADMQEKVQAAQARLQDAQADTNKAQQLATIELIKSQEHAAQIQDFVRLNSRLQERLEDVRNDYSEQLRQVEEEKQQAEQQALDRILQAEGEAQKARQAEKLAIDRAQTLEEDVRKAQEAEQAAFDKSVQAEENSQRAQQAEKLAMDRAAILEEDLQKAREAEKVAGDRVVRAEGESQKACDAKKIAIDRALALEEEVLKAQAAAKTALDKASQAEAEKEQAIQQAETLQAQATSAAEEFDERLRQCQKQHALEIEQHAKDMIQQQREFAACADQELVRIRECHAKVLDVMEKEMAELKTVSENAQNGWRNDRRQCDVLDQQYRELERQHKQVVADLEIDKQRRHDEARLPAVRRVKLEEGDDNDDEQDRKPVLDLDQGRADPGVGGSSKKRKRRRQVKSSQPPTAETTPALTATSASISTSPSTSFDRMDVTRAPDQVRHAHHPDKL